VKEASQSGVKIDVFLGTQLYKIESLKPIKGVYDINKKQKDQNELYQNSAVLVTVQIQFSLDMFLKKSDSCGLFPHLTKRSWRNCHIWNWAQFCKEIAQSSFSSFSEMIIQGDYFAGAFNASNLHQIWQNLQTNDHLTFIYNPMWSI